MTAPIARVLPPLAVVAVFAFGGWMLGHGTGADVASASDRGGDTGLITGTVEGKRDGRADGRSAGIEATQSASFKSAHAAAFRRSYAVTYKREFDIAYEAEKARLRAIADPNGDGSGCPLYHARPYGDPTGPCIPPAHPPSTELRPWEHCPDGGYPVGVTGACAPI